MKHADTMLLVAALLTLAVPSLTTAQAQDSYTLSADTVAAIEKASPSAPLVPPSQPRRILVYGRERTHPESVVCCFKAMEILAKKTGAFQVTSSGDPQVFLPESLQQFDAVVMNNTHERFPMLPENFDQLSAAAKAKAREMEPALKKSLLEFVAGGKGIVGIHGATAGGVQWPEYNRLFGAEYLSHITETVWVKPAEPDNPLCSFLGGKSFEVHDEIYMFRKAGTREPLDRSGLQVLLTLDLTKTKDPGQRADKDYVLSWIRPYEKGRVFYNALGHCATAYTNPAVLELYLAGIQWAIGDLKANDSIRKQ